MTFGKMKHLLSILLLAVFFSAYGNEIKLTSLTVEMQDGSQPLATAEPRFSWKYETEENNVIQTEYRIIVASSEENARKGIGDLWDSKIVASNQMLYIPYEGKTLKSRDCCWWKLYSTVTCFRNDKSTKQKNINSTNQQKYYISRATSITSRLAFFLLTTGTPIGLVVISMMTCLMVIPPLLPAICARNFL